jgi:AcrR family transcriptional regulator
MTERNPRRSPAGGERQRDPERTKAKILEAATVEFGAKGFAATRVSDIADRAGVNKQLISYYFGGKEGLYVALTNRWQQASTDVSDSELPLDAVVAGFVMGNLHNRDWARLMVWSNLDSASGPPGHDADRAFLQAQVTELRRRQEAGELPDDLDPAYLMLALFAAAAAGVTLPRVARMVCDQDPESEEFATRYAEQLARLIRHLNQTTPH